MVLANVSKAAVVVLMTFFPMLIATLAGLRAAGRLELELMHSYAAGYLRTLLDLRLPCALPFIMSALKINATLALTIGTPAAFAPFVPGVTKPYEAATTANVTSTAGDALLSVADASATATRPAMDVSGAFMLSPQPAPTERHEGSSASPGAHPLPEFRIQSPHGSRFRRAPERGPQARR